MPLPQTTSQLDPATGYQIPTNSGTWANASTWGSYTSWISQPSTSIVVVSDIIDRGSVGLFNVKTTADVSGDISYSVFTSNTGEFQGEEIETIFTPYTTNASAFLGRYFAVCANVTSSSGSCELRSLGIAHTNNNFDLHFNNISTEDLDLGEYGSILPMPRAVGAINNIQATAHLPSDASARYIYTGNDDTGYIVNYNGNSTTLSNTITSAGEATAYTAFTSLDNYGANPATGGTLKIYKTINSSNWTVLSNPGNVAANITSVQFSPHGSIVAVGSTQDLRLYFRNNDTFAQMRNPDYAVSKVRSIAWSPSNEHLAVVGAFRNDNNTPGTDDSRDVYVFYSPEAASAPAYDPFLATYDIKFYDVLLPNSSIRNSNLTSNNPNYSRVVAWDPSSTYLAVGLSAQQPGSAPWPEMVEIYKKNSNTSFSKLSFSSGLDPNNVYITSIDWHPTGNWLAVAMIGSPRLKIYYRSGDTFIPITVSVPEYGNYNFAKWNPQGTHLAWTMIHASAPTFGATQKSFDFFKQTGNTFAYLNAMPYGPPNTYYPAEGPSDWSIGSNVFISAQRIGTSGEVYTYFYNVTYFANSNVSLSRISGLGTSTGPGFYNPSSWLKEYTSKIPVANVSIFNPTGGNIRVDGESMRYLVANATPNPPRLEGVTRGVSTTQFGNSIATSHAIGAQVFPIEQLDFTQRYYDVQPITSLVAYVGSKSRTQPAINIKTLSGSDTDGTFDAVVNVLPEQYMDSTNLNYR
ncbi:hypothetical protein UFOVP640_15 [uncultured Caudovirales phage]|uniref:WD40/YVTN repeat-like-containing domain containing protein n=1 Tax=uncultured Caudovirales phage TaxID=2100421 RepID=A0A6J7X4S6_9CAUD|nr:hypothetical protein UFOVP640_15 [uncultured Caudovirales phage]CAB5225984.1 hypothetical protein UFOVP759_19 [uncultured Caudovirales phage]